MENGRDDAVASGASERIRVLVVDEDPVHLEAMTQTLSRCGYQVTTKASPAEALQELQENPDRIDLVMTVAHIRGDGINGFTLLEQARDHYPVILFSDDATAETVRRGFIGGACDFLIKPLHDDVMRNICHHVKQRRINTAPSVGPMNADSRSNHIAREDRLSGKRPIAVDDSNEGRLDSRTTKGIKFHWTAHKHAFFHRATNRLSEIKDYAPRNIRELTTQEDSANATTDKDSSHLQKNKGDCPTDWLSTMPTSPQHYNDYPKSQDADGSSEFNMRSKGPINLNQTSQLSNIASAVGFGFHGNGGSTTSLGANALRVPVPNIVNGDDIGNGNGALANGSMVSASLPSNLERPLQQPVSTLNLFPSNTMLPMDNPNHRSQRELPPHLYRLSYDCSIGGIRMSPWPVDDDDDLLRSYLGENEVIQNTATTDMAHGIQNAATMDITTVETTHEIPGDGAADQTSAVQLQGLGSELFHSESTTVEAAGTSGAGGVVTDEMMHGINMEEFMNFMNQEV
ncbi:Two-component response regulator ARR11 [Hordeum vulgare]|nr:Two-component response regulator ARR11 [Hordeum vulgare]